MRLKLKSSFDLVLVGFLLWLFCLRIWGLGLTHTDDAVWALQAYTPEIDTIGDWARDQGRIWAYPIGAMMMHALKWQGTFYGEFLRTSSLLFFFISFHLFIVIYCGRTIAFLSSVISLGLFVMCWEGSILTTYPLLLFPSASSFFLSAIMGRIYIIQGRKWALYISGLLLFVSMFNNEGFTALVCALYLLTTIATDRQIHSRSKPWRLLQSPRTIFLFLMLGGTAIAYAAIAGTWRYLHPSNYSGHVLGSWDPVKFAPVLFSFASSNNILSWLIRPYTVTFGDAIGGFGNRITYDLTDALTGVARTPLAIVVGCVAAVTMFRLVIGLKPDPAVQADADSRVEPIWAIIFGLAIAIIQLLPVSLIQSYQSWYFDQGVLANHYSIFAHFGICLSVSGLVVLLLRPVWKPVLVLTAIPLSLVFGAFATAAYKSSDRIVLDMRLETGRWRILEAALTGIDLLAPTAKVLFAPRLANGSWFTVVPSSYWSKLLAARYERELVVKTAGYVEDDLKDGMVTLDYDFAGDDPSYAIVLSRHHLKPTAGLEKDFVDAIAVHVEHETQSQASKTILVYENISKVITQIPLSALKTSADGRWHVLEAIDAIPTSIRIGRNSQIARSMLHCSEEPLLGGVVVFGVSIAASGPFCTGDRFLRAGWAPLEATGVWTIADKAGLSLPRRSLPPGDLMLAMNASTFTGMGFYEGHQRITVRAAGEILSQWSPTSADDRDWEFVVPHRLRTREGGLDLVVQIEHPIQPKSVGLSPDERNLGLNLCSLLIRSIAERDQPRPNTSCPKDYPDR